MKKEELQEIFALPNEAGVKYELCDTPVPVSLSGVPCGFSESLNDECIDDYYLVPKSLVGPHPEMFVHAIGDSMLEDGYGLAKGVSANLATYIADRMAESLNITHKWKVFQALWNIKNMAQLAGSWKETGKLPPRADEIDELF